MESLWGLWGVLVLFVDVLLKKEYRGPDPTSPPEATTAISPSLIGHHRTTQSSSYHKYHWIGIFMKPCHGRTFRQSELDVSAPYSDCLRWTRCPMITGSIHHYDTADGAHATIPIPWALGRKENASHKSLKSSQCRFPPRSRAPQPAALVP